MHNSKNNKYSKNKNNKPQLAKAPNSSKSLIIETSELKKDSNKREQETPFLEKIQKIIKGKSNTFSECFSN